MQYPSMLDEALADEDLMQRVRTILMWVLLGVGFYLVAFPASFAWPLVAKPDGRGYGWSPEELAAVAQTFRSVGFLLFGAGLIERILIRLGK